MSKSHFAVSLVLAAPLFTLASCALLSPSEPKAAIYRITVSGAN